MARCQTCEYPISDDRERVGARCPSCHDPIYEPPTRMARPARPDEAACATHPQWESVGTCARCGQHLCETCRTRWRGLVLCGACVSKALDSAEATPAQAQAGYRQALASVLFSGAAWAIAAAAGTILRLGPAAGADAAPVYALAGLLLLAAAVLPAAVGVGQAMAALRGETEQVAMALTGLAAGGLYAAVVLGLGSLTLWQS